MTLEELKKICDKILFKFGCARYEFYEFRREKIYKKIKKLFGIKELSWAEMLERRWHYMKTEGNAKIQKELDKYHAKLRKKEKRKGIIRKEIPHKNLTAEEMEEAIKKWEEKIILFYKIHSNNNDIKVTFNSDIKATFQKNLENAKYKYENNS